VVTPTVRAGVRAPIHETHMQSAPRPHPL